MEPNLLRRTTADVLEEALSSASRDVYVVDPARDTLEELVSVMSGTETPTVRLLATERVLKDVMDDFLVASRAADLVESERMELRSYDGSESTLVVTGERVLSVVRAGDRIAGLGTDEEAFVASANEQYDGVWADAEPFVLRTPAMSRVRDSLQSDLGEATAGDFEAVLDSLETARGDGEGLDEVTISLLVTAKNNELLYDVSKWGEDVGIASKATFSRTKTRLEELGLVDTEKVPIDVGRPRLRLLLGDDRLRGADADELSSVAQSVLAQAS
ncbi:hypothetical protein BRC93_15345 [Halobacteriales archaeon QS_5_70_15]|nr:MAG: hypothetical protein BRC93_15345 [Halobacteriales archaeon QS_5_70_15]